MRTIISVQLPAELVAYVRTKAKSTFSSVGSVIRSAIILDRAANRTPQPPAMTEDDGKMIPLRQLRRARKGGAK